MSIIMGSFVPEGTPDHHFFQAPVLTAEGICAKHKITGRELEKLKKEVGSKKLSTILLKFPESPQYNMLLHLVATTK
ncbi:MAG: hypothetical protein H0T51_21270 [Pirellulales bacterium]|nr:hypothetical protein [Pirellulales bacterium]